MTEADNIPLPNFLIVGAAKCGTTSLYHYARVHPEVFMPERKEPFYFVKPKTLLGRGPGKLGSHHIDSERDYRDLFAAPEALSAKALGEASAGYLYFHERTIPEIKKLLGEPSIVIILRDPAERAFSCHLHHVRNRLESLSFEQALAAQEERREKNWWFGYHTLVDVGFYYEPVRHFMESFANVQVHLFEDLKRNTPALMKSLFEFLGVDPGFQPDTTKKHNPGGAPRFGVIDDLLAHESPLMRAARGVARRVGGMDQVLEAQKRLRTWNSYKPELPAETRRRLVGMYRYDILKLQELIGRDLSAWLE